MNLNYFRIALLLVGIAVPNVSVNGQTPPVLPPDPPPINEIDPELLGLPDELEEEDSGSIDDEIDRWDYLMNHPVNINSASFNDFMQIPGMRPAYARALINYRQRQGAYTSLTVLFRVPAVPDVVVQRMLPFLTLGTVTQHLRQTVLQPKFWMAGAHVESISRLRTTVERQQGYKQTDTTDPSYLGPPFERYQRVQLRTRHLTTGIVMKSGAGVPGTWFRPNFGSLHFQTTELPGFSAVAIGDYKVNYGLGLSMNSGRSIKKGYQLVRLGLPSRTVTSSTSSSYLNHHKGGGVTFGTKIRTSGWYSSRSYTGTEVDSQTVRWSASEPTFRTGNDLNRRDNFRVHHYGARVEIPFHAFRMGIATWISKSDKIIEPTYSTYTRMGLKGDEFAMYSLDYQLVHQKGSLTGEIALDKVGNIASLQVAELSVLPSLSSTIIHRYYAAGFMSPYGAAFGAWSGRPSNERGIYTGWEYVIRNKIQFMAFIDLYSSIDPRSNDALPTAGRDAALQVRYQSGDFALAVSSRIRNKSEVTPSDDVFGRSYSSSVMSQLHFNRLDLTWQQARTITMTTRAEWVSSNSKSNSTDTGLLVYHDVKWRLNPTVRLQARVSFFNTDSYASRLFSYEPDVALSSGTQAYQGQGIRQFLVLAITPWKNVECQFKYAQTSMPHVNSLGSGNDQIDGNKRTHISSSLRVRI